MALFPAPTGLADGLALKELRYAASRWVAIGGDSPQNCPFVQAIPRVPRVQPPQTKKAGLRLVDGRHANSDSGRHLAAGTRKLRPQRPATAATYAATFCASAPWYRPAGI